MKVVLETIGCKLNQAETENLSWDLAIAGYEVTSRVTDADIFLLNTCSVTGTADARSRQRIRHVRKSNPETFIIVTGCLAERDGASLAEIAGKGVIVSNKDKATIARLVKTTFDGDSRGSCAEDTTPQLRRTRSFIKVQEGCNGGCAYCIVPRVRGSEQSVPLKQVIKQIRQREKAGIKEIVITGTNVGRYADNGSGLDELLKAILNQTAIPRIRLSSLQPEEITTELLAQWHNNRLLPHFHMSLQSGSDVILQRMKRRYSVDQFREAVSRIRARIPGAAVTTDIIVGFPGENEVQFTESYRTCERLEFARIHVFPFSPRPGTAAATLPETVKEPLKQLRLHSMLDLAEKSAAEFRERCRGQERPVLWEARDRGGFWTGWTDNYIQIKDKRDNPGGQIEMVKIDK